MHTYYSQDYASIIYLPLVKEVLLVQVTLHMNLCRLAGYFPVDMSDHSACWSDILSVQFVAAIICQTDPIIFTMASEIKFLGVGRSLSVISTGSPS